MAGGRGSGMDTFRADDGGVLLVLLPKDLDARLTAQSTIHIPKPLSLGDETELTVRLERRPRIRLVLPDGLRLPHRTHVSVGAGPVQNIFAGDGDLVLRPPAVGRLPVTLMGPDLRTGVVWRGTIEVGPGEALQDIPLPIDASVIEKLRAR